jgi:alpha-galactosidase
MNKTEITIAYIGGGSREWAPKLMADLALCPELAGELRLYDLSLEAARANVDVGQLIFGHPDARTTFQVRAVDGPEKALQGADFVVLSIEPGPISMRYADLEIPAKYGIVQPVGDTTGPGGILRALRAVPVYEDYSHRIMVHCPRAWVINYTNPMTICTAALYAAEPEIRAFGCCHEVFGTQRRLAALVADWFGVQRPDEKVIRLDVAGVNHFTFATAALWENVDLFPRLLEMIGAEGFFADHTAEALKRREQESWFESDGLIAFDFLARFGALGAAGDRHLAEFVPWYLGSEEDLHRWGVVLTPYSWRVRRSEKPSRREVEAPLLSSGEEGVRQILALLGGGSFVTNVNVPNRGQVPGLPTGAVVESYAHFEQRRIRPIVSRPLPLALAGITRHIVDLQSITLRAARTRDRDLAFQALLSDPLVRIPTDRAWQMFGEMLDHAAEALPGW